MSVPITDEETERSEVSDTAGTGSQKDPAFLQATGLSQSGDHLAHSHLARPVEMGGFCGPTPSLVIRISGP